MTQLSDELLIPVRRELIKHTTITSLVGDSPSTIGPWIFRWEPGFVMEGSGKACVVLQHNGSWAQGNLHNTTRFPIIAVQCIADTTRDANGNQLNVKDAPDKALALWRAVNTVMTVRFNDQRWGAGDAFIRVISSMPSGEPTPIPLSEASLTAIAAVNYNLEVA